MQHDLPGARAYRFQDANLIYLLRDEGVDRVINQQQTQDKRQYT